MLTDDKKIFINKKVEEGLNDYVVIANLLYNCDNLTGRSKEAKEVRNYLISTGFAKKETRQRFAPTKEILTQAHQEFINQNIQTGITPKQITELLFNEKFQGLDNLNLFITPEYRSVHKYIKEKYPEFLVENESGVNQKYAVPRSLKTVMNKVNRWCGQNIIGRGRQSCLLGLLNVNVLSNSILFHECMD